MNARIVLMIGLVLLFSACSKKAEKAVPEEAEKPVVEQAVPEEAEKPAVEQAVPEAAEKPVVDQAELESKETTPAVEETAPAGEEDPFVAEVRQAIELFVKTDPGMKEFFDNARGYVVFPTVGKGGIGLGAARGKGLAYEAGDRVGEVVLTQITVGAQLGGQTYSEVLFLESKETMDSLKQGNFGLSAEVSATAAAAGASANAKYKQGVAVFTMAKGGLMFQASVGGQKFKFIPLEQ